MHRLEFRSEHQYPPEIDGIELPVALECGGVRVETLAFVDTGASYCFFQRELGEALGLDFNAGVRQAVVTVTGRFEAVAHGVTLTVLDVVLDSVVYFFVDESIQKNVLGRNGWLNRIRLGLVDHDQRCIWLLLTPESNAR
jgi:hypothetical protein